MAAHGVQAVTGALAELAGERCFPLVSPVALAAVQRRCRCSHALSWAVLFCRSVNRERALPTCIAPTIAHTGIISVSVVVRISQKIICIRLRMSAVLMTISCFCRFICCRLYFYRICRHRIFSFLPSVPPSYILLCRDHYFRVGIPSSCTNLQSTVKDLHVYVSSTCIVR